MHAHAPTRGGHAHAGLGGRRVRGLCRAPAWRLPARTESRFRSASGAAATPGAPSRPKASACWHRRANARTSLRCRSAASRSPRQSWRVGSKPAHRTARRPFSALAAPMGSRRTSTRKARLRWSLSALTLPHGLARVVVAEALYRAVSLIKGSRTIARLSPANHAMDSEGRAADSMLVWLSSCRGAVCIRYPHPLDGTLDRVREAVSRVHGDRRHRHVARARRGRPRPCRETHGKSRAQLPDQQFARLVHGGSTRPSLSAETACHGQRSIYLASASPRRGELLRRSVSHTRCGRSTSTSRRGGEAPAQYALRLAQEKARALWERVPDAERRPVLAADTTVALGDEILGKPADRAEAVGDAAAPLRARTRGAHGHRAAARGRRGFAAQHEQRDVSHVDRGRNRRGTGRRASRPTRPAHTRCRARQQFSSGTWPAVIPA